MKLACNGVENDEYYITFEGRACHFGTQSAAYIFCKSSADGVGLSTSRRVDSLDGCNRDLMIFSLHGTVKAVSISEESLIKVTRSTNHILIPQFLVHALDTRG